MYTYGIRYIQLLIICILVFIGHIMKTVIVINVRH